jgi:hypothetical protein
MSIRISKGGRLFGIVAALGGAVMIGGAALTWTKAVRVTYFLPYEISELNGADRIATLVLDVRQRALLTPKTPTQPRNSTRSTWPGSLSDRRIHSWVGVFSPHGPAVRLDRGPTYQTATAPERAEPAEGHPRLGGDRYRRCARYCGRRAHSLTQAHISVKGSRGADASRSSNRATTRPRGR